MAKKASSKSSTSAATNYNKTLIQIQKLANSSAKSIQDSINKSNEQQATFNSAEAQKSRLWQEKMSKSAHQMEVADLKKAGLNPVLSSGGTGAQSYTTSSASTQNDSGASATAAILSGELGAMSNMESARMSADAQQKAATMSAKATRYAAQQSAAAQKYASDQAYRLGVYKADLDYNAKLEGFKTQKYVVDTQTKNARWLLEHTPEDSKYGLIDKYAQYFGIPAAVRGALRSSAWTTSTLVNYDKAWKKSPSKITEKNFSVDGSLTQRGLKIVKNNMNSTGIRVTGKSIDLYCRAVFFHDKKAGKELVKNYVVNPIPAGGR